MLFSSLLRSTAPIAIIPAIFITSMAVQPALAQSGEKAEADNTKFDEIIVTTRRREETLIDTPVAVSAFSAEALEGQSVSNISEVAQGIPSVTLKPTRATSTTITAFIRGVGQQDPLAGFEPGVAIYVDDVYLARPQGALLDVYDVERIEVLRGPQGTLYGRNAVGGAVKYVTRELSDEPFVKARLSAGSYNQLEGVVSASYPVSDSVRIGGAVARLKRDGYGENVTTGEDNYNKDLYAARASLLLMPMEGLKISISGDYTKDNSNPVFGHRENDANVSGETVRDNVYETSAGAAENASSDGIDGKNELKAKGVAGTIEYEINDRYTVKSITAWRKDDTKSVIDFDSLPVDDFDAIVVYDNKQFSQEFQLLYTSDRLNAVVGFYYLDAQASNDFDVVLGQLGRLAYGTEITAYTGGTIKTKAWSVFGDVTYNLTDELSISVGGRYTSDKRSADVLRETYLGVGSSHFGSDSSILIATTSDFEASRRFKDFSPRAVLAYKANENFNIYASYSQGFKAGSFDPRGANFIIADVVDGYEPETLNTFELGIKSTPLDGRAMLNVALFYSDYKDMQIPGSVEIDTDNDGINDDFAGTVTNAGKATIMGIEVESMIKLSPSLTLQGNVSILDAKIKEWIFNGTDVSAERVVQNTPEFNSLLGMNYKLGLGDGNGDLNFYANWSYTGKVYFFETPSDIDQDAYGIANLGLSWTSANGKINAGLHVKNVADARYRTAGYDFPTLGLENNVTTFWGAPRTVTFTVGVTY